MTFGDDWGWGAPRSTKIYDAGDHRKRVCRDGGTIDGLTTKLPPK
jgi:hypothetical protein